MHEASPEQQLAMGVIADELYAEQLVQRLHKIDELEPFVMALFGCESVARSGDAALSRAGTADESPRSRWPLGHALRLLGRLHRLSQPQRAHSGTRQGPRMARYSRSCFELMSHPASKLCCVLLVLLLWPKATSADDKLWSERSGDALVDPESCI